MLKISTQSKYIRVRYVSNKNLNMPSLVQFRFDVEILKSEMFPCLVSNLLILQQHQAV